MATGSPCIARTIAPGSKREFEEHFGWLFLVPDLQSFPDAVMAMEFEKEYQLVKVTDDDNTLPHEDDDESDLEGGGEKGT